MTPRFARAVDPIFKHVLDLLDRIHHGEQPDPREERLLIRGLLEQGHAFLGASREWELASYAIIAWIDEMLVDVPWQGAEWWSNNVLEVELFNTRLCYENFFVLAKEASSMPQRDALEVFYLCMMLGFRGLYRDPELGETFIEAHGLPPDLESWARQTAMSIRLGQGRPGLARPARELGGAEPLTTPAFPVWCWVVAAMTALAVVVWLLAIRQNLGV
jgi:type VI secretion system protein ImpK